MLSWTPSRIASHGRLCSTFALCLERESSVTCTLVGVGIATYVQEGTLVQPSITAAEIVADAQEGAVITGYITGAGAAISVGFAADAWVMYSFCFQSQVVGTPTVALRSPSQPHIASQGCSRKMVVIRFAVCWLQPHLMCFALAGGLCSHTQGAAITQPSISSATISTSDVEAPSQLRGPFQ